jgi:hypothetical protein
MPTHVVERFPHAPVRIEGREVAAQVLRDRLVQLFFGEVEWHGFGSRMNARVSMSEID